VTFAIVHSSPRPLSVPLAGALLAGTLALLSSAQAASFAGVEVPAPLPPQPVVDVHWGVSVEDPYRFLENTADPRVQAWMKKQSDATAAILAQLPGRDRLRARLGEIDAEIPAVVSRVHRDARGRLTYLKRTAAENQLKLVRRDSIDGPERPTRSRRTPAGRTPSARSRHRPTTRWSPTRCPPPAPRSARCT
jgi:prolyl oligopeptidase